MFENYEFVFRLAIPPQERSRLFDKALRLYLSGLQTQKKVRASLKVKPSL